MAAALPQPPRQSLVYAPLLLPFAYTSLVCSYGSALADMDELSLQRIHTGRTALEGYDRGSRSGCRMPLPTLTATVFNSKISGAAPAVCLPRVSPAAVQVQLPVLVRPVWAWNFADEWAYLQNFAAGARYVAFDVHYPGVVHAAGQDHKSMTVEERYALMKANVDELKTIKGSSWRGSSISATSAARPTRTRRRRSCTTAKQ
ncbi:hypothetical protein ZWY2020_027720 [Hordeum vulgare]|nr:hypothetical protein ZWY2020_027720 [Hordeum vulgare]